MKEKVSVLLILILSLGIVFSAHDGLFLFLFNATAQSINSFSTSKLAASLLNVNLIPDAHAACNPPCIAPKPTTLTLNPVPDTPMCTTATATGKLAYSIGTGIDGEGIFTSDNGGTVPGAVITKSDGTFSASFTAPCSVSSGWHFQAHFAGDSDINALGSNSAIQTYNTLKLPTSLFLGMNPYGVNIPWGATVQASGILSGGGNGLPSEPITFTSSDGSPLPTSVFTGTDQSHGLYSATFRVSNTLFNGWNIQAHFAGDSTYQATDSNIQSYNTVKHITALTISVPSNIPWGTTATVTGKLTDSSSSDVGLASKTITFTTSNGSPLPASVTTASDGTYKATFTASNTIFSGWNIQAHFAEDSLYDASTSTVATYNTVKHTTSLTLAVPSSVP